MANVAHPHRPHLALPHVDWHGIKPLPLSATLAVGIVIWLVLGGLWWKVLGLW